MKRIMCTMILLLTIFSDASASFRSDVLHYKPLTINESTSTKCERRVNASVARMEVGVQPNKKNIHYCADKNLTSNAVGSGNAMSTAFLVSLDPPIMLTNRHNFNEPLNRGLIDNNQDPCKTGQVNFTFSGLNNQKVRCEEVMYSFPSDCPSSVSTQTCDRINKDAVFIKLDKLPEGANYLPLHRGAPLERESVQIAGHPMGSDQINHTRCNILPNNLHTCGTVTGNSGSPILTSNCKVSGLHSGADRLGGMCDQDLTSDNIYNKEESCLDFKKSPVVCMNKFVQTDILAQTLSQILNREVEVRDESQHFDSMERYGKRKLEDSPALTPEEARSIE